MKQFILKLIKPTYRILYNGELYKIQHRPAFLPFWFDGLYCITNIHYTDKGMISARMFTIPSIEVAESLIEKDKAYYTGSKITIAKVVK